MNLIDNHSSFKIAFQTVLSTVGLIVTALCMMSVKQRTLENLGYVIAVAAIFALLMLHLILGVGCLESIIKYVFIYKNRVSFYLCTSYYLQFRSRGTYLDEK